MKKSLKLLLCIPSFLTLLLIPYNFFADFNLEESDTFFHMFVGIQLAFLICLIVILRNLWNQSGRTKSEKWVWTLLMILLFQPITTLIYLWAIEPENSSLQNS